MTAIRGQSTPTHRLARLVTGLGAMLLLGLLAASSARAGFEGTGYFAGSATPVAEEKFTEEVQLGGVGGMAVNYTGNGGVPAGTVYAVTKTASESTRIAMFTPEGDGLKFWLGWEVRELEEPYESCGPGLGTKCPTRVKADPRNVDIDINQATGNVYVENGTTSTGRKVIVVYKPDGSGVISRFGELIGEEKSVTETPDKIHRSPYAGPIAVNGAGEVYVFDMSFADGHQRLMKFVPKVPGNFSEYEYAKGGDVGAGIFGDETQPAEPVADAAGNVYVAAEQSAIEMYDPSKPGDPPICTFKFPKGGITALTVDPESGEVFFFSYKPPKRIHQLSPCDPGTGTFKEGGQVEVKPERDDIWALAFDPKRQLPGRPPGVLYAAAPGPVPNSGVGKGEPEQSSLGYIFAPTSESPPVVKSESVAKVTSSSAELHAAIDPQSFKTEYVFQYLSEAAYQEDGESFSGAVEAPAGGAVAGEGKGAVGVAVTLTSLAPGTAYRYRVIAKSNCSPGEPKKVCEDAGEVQAFRTYPVQLPGLSDGRAYELVSPALKSGGEVFPADPRISSCGGLVDCKPGLFLLPYFPMVSSADGEAVAYEGYAFVPGEGAAIENEYVARRTATGWVSTNPTPSLLRSKNAPGYMLLDSTLSEAILAQSSIPSLGEAPSGYENLYAQPLASPLALRPLVSGGFQRSGNEFNLSFTGAAADLSRVFFSANDALTPATPFAPAAVDGGANKDNLYEWERATGQLRLVNVFPENLATEPDASFGFGSAHAISADGSRAFWSDKAGIAYVREDATATRLIPGSGPGAGFLAAASDGSRVLLGDGHIYDLEAKETIDLTAGKAGFEGLAGQSDDLTHLYFVDSAVLDEVPNSEGAVAQAGKDNLYAWSGGTARFVATLLAKDNSDGDNRHTWSAIPSARTAEASPNGRFLAFLSQAELTGYGNLGPCELIGETGNLKESTCPEAFLYDSQTGKLSCASCNPSGSSPLGWSVLRLIKAPPSLPQARYLTDSGRLYFDSRDSLSPADTNEGVEDVYRFEPEGTGGCNREGGCVELISAGRSGVDSNLLGTDATGKNVFFTSRDRLVGSDQDELIDLYDAREGGGFGGEAELPPVPCQGEGCLPLPLAPSKTPPPSATLNDPGNAKPAKGCKKGQVKKNGKCVKKKQKQKKKGKSKRDNRGGGK